MSTACLLATASNSNTTGVWPGFLPPSTNCHCSVAAALAKALQTTSLPTTNLSW